jgi:hypothetical protein
VERVKDNFKVFGLKSGITDCYQRWREATAVAGLAGVRGTGIQFGEFQFKKIPRKLLNTRIWNVKGVFGIQNVVTP